MRPLVLLFALLLTCCFSMAQNKLAMIVAVGQYAPGSGVPPIASANDIKYLKAVLNRNGFLDKNIQTLINAKATKEAILKGLNGLAVKARRNDIVVITFACHGQQIRDQKTIELGKDEDDGYDEALLPYDAKGRYSPTGYKGEKHLRDDELYTLLMAIRQKTGPNGSVLVLLDACHSGTGTRAESFAVTRGDPVPFPDPENPLDSVINLSAAEARQGFFESNADSLSNMVVISGSAPHQENKQLVINYEELGSLSYSFYKAMSDMPAGNNYGLLFEKIKTIIQAYIPDQVPVIEGNTRQVIFSGKYTPIEEKLFLRVGVKNIPVADDSVFTIEKGRMDNITVGATCKIYTAGSAVLFTEGVIRKVENFRSIGVAAKLLKRTALYELKLTEEQYGELQAGLKLSFGDTTAHIPRIEAQVKQLIQPYRFLRFADNADFQLDIKQEAETQLALLTDRNNRLLWSGTLTGPDSLSTASGAAMITSIKQAMRIRYLRTMEDGGDLAGMVTVKIETEQPQDTARGIILSEGDRYLLKIRNNSPFKLFYTVLDIYPDNKVEVLYPGKGKEPSDYIIDKGAPVIRKLSVSKGTPEGREFLKVIVSKEPLDLRSVIEQKVQRDEMHSFQLVLDDLFNETDPLKATRADVSSIKAEEIGILTVHFVIKK
jgi:metacaspase-1